MSNQGGANVLRAQYQQSAQWFMGTMQGVTGEIAHHSPGDLISPISGQAAHVVTGLDFLLLGAVTGQAPLIMSSFAGKTGISEPPPPGGAWLEWGQRVKVDLPALHEYANAVFGAIDSYLASTTDNDLQVEVEIAPVGKLTRAGWFSTLLLNTYSHSGEISCIKGLQGQKGYPA